MYEVGQFICKLSMDLGDATASARHASIYLRWTAQTYPSSHRPNAAVATRIADLGRCRSISGRPDDRFAD